MPSSHLLARDHLQRAATILQGTDSQSQQIRYILERAISLIEDNHPEEAPRPASNVVDLVAFRDRQFERG